MKKTKFECVFLDRDGVINHERADYVKIWDEFSLLPNVLDALVKLAQSNLPIIIITNQSAIGRGAATRAAIDRIHQQFINLVQDAGGRVDDLLLCPHHPDEHCFCRKPKPGLLLQAAVKHNFNLPNCIFIGDAITDFQAAFAASCQSILVRTGRQGNQIDSLIDSYLQVEKAAKRPEIVDNLSCAIERITNYS